MNKKLTEGLKPLKKVEGRLPSLLDTLWDVKYVEDIYHYNLQDNQTLHRILAEHGYDVKGWLSERMNQLTEHEKNVRSNVRNFLMVATLAELQKELEISKERNDKLRERFVQELIDEKNSE